MDGDPHSEFFVHFVIAATSCFSNLCVDLCNVLVVSSKEPPLYKIHPRRIRRSEVKGKAWVLKVPLAYGICLMGGVVIHNEVDL
jgi:hypothetical protein